MLKFLTHKLRTHSLNEENIPDKVDGHDSGTESDDEIDRPDAKDSSASHLVCNAMRECTFESSSPVAAPPAAMAAARPTARAARPRSGPASPAPQAPAPAHTILLHSPYLMAPVTDLQYDQHSSEEELEVINSTPKEMFRKYVSGPVRGGAARGGRGARPARPASAAPPEKRKWSQTQCQSADPDRLASPFSAAVTVAENDENAAYNSAGAEPHSSDEEVLRSPDALPAPVRFRTSPPVEALKPRRAEGLRAHRGAPLTALGGRACSCCVPPPPAPTAPAHPPQPAQELFHYEVSPRKRSRHSSRRHIQRPCLDFDKMQQLKVRAVTAWRHGGAEHGGELSVFCW